MVRKTKLSENLLSYLMQRSGTATTAKKRTSILDCIITGRGIMRLGCVGLPSVLLRGVSVDPVAEDYPQLNRYDYAGNTHNIEFNLTRCTDFRGSYSFPKSW